MPLGYGLVEVRSTSDDDDDDDDDGNGGGGGGTEGREELYPFLDSRRCT
jgi:hypothetical protein